MTDEERKALVDEMTLTIYRWEKEEPREDWWADQHQYAKAKDQIEADGKRIAELEAALQLLHDNIVHAWPAVADLGPVASARAALGEGK